MREFSLALITGGSSGIGAAIAELLGRKGVRLLLSGRNPDRLGEVGKRLGAELCVGDLLDLDARSRLIEKIWERVPDLIINCAGFGLYGPVLDRSISDQLAILDLNGRVLTELTLCAALALKRAGRSGVILNVSSAGAFVPMPHAALYGASKAYVNALSLNLDLELREHGIRVLAACPGMVETRFRQRAARGHVQSSSRGTMKASRAADQLWKQIQRRQRLRVFSWPYQLGIWATRVLPHSWVAKLVRGRLNARLP